MSKFPIPDTEGLILSLKANVKEKQVLIDNLIRENMALKATQESLLVALKKLAEEHQNLLQEQNGFYPMNCCDYAFLAITQAERERNYEKTIGRRENGKKRQN